jgi:hypothetical protein
MPDYKAPYMNLREISPGAFARCAWLLAAALFLAQYAGPSLAKEQEPQFTSKEFLEPIKFLASDKLKGRGDGTKELDEAAQRATKPAAPCDLSGPEVGAGSPARPTAAP